MDLTCLESIYKDAKIDMDLYEEMAKVMAQTKDLEPWLIDFESDPQIIFSSENLNFILGIQPKLKGFQNYLEDVVEKFSSKMSADKIDFIIDSFSGVIDGRYDTYDVIYDFFDNTGKRRWINAVLLKAERNGSGKITKMLGTHRDVTDIYQQKESITNVFESCSDIVFTTNLVDITKFNHSYKTYFSTQTNAAKLLQQIRRRINPGHNLTSLDIDYIKQNPLKSLQVQINTNECQTDFIMFIQPIDQDSGEYVIRLTRVTSEIKNSFSIKKAQNIFEHSSEGIIFTDLNCNIISVNQSFTQITGYTQSDIIGKNPSMMASGLQSEHFYREMWDDINKKGIWKGEICNRHKNGEVYYENLTIKAIYDEYDTLSNYVGMFSDITAQKRQKEELEYLAHHDHLTSLANRTLLTKRLTSAIKSKRSFSVLYLDLDGFKKINDTYGHAAGDFLLIELSKRFKNIVRKQDTVARIGGDEFVILMHDITDTSDCLFIIERLLVQASSDIHFKEHILQVTASLGATFFNKDRDGATDLDKLLKQADSAMYHAKRSGKNCFKLFDKSMQEEVDSSACNKNSISKQTNTIANKLLSDKRNAIRANILECLVRNLPLTDILLKIIEGVEIDFPGMMCSILLVDQSGKLLVDGIAPSLPSFYNEAIDGIKIDLNRGSCGHAAATKKRMIVDDIATHPNWSRVKHLAEKAGLASCWSEPIIGAEGKVLGTFAIYHTQKTTPAIDDFKLIDMSAQLAALAIEKDSANKALWKSLNYDPLTELSNKNLFVDKVKAELSVPNNKFGLFHIDIKQFHLINHSFGHEFGDQVLINVANRLKSIIKKQDDIGRINGDEFIVLVNGNINVLNMFASEITKHIRKPLHINNEELHLNVCIGISVFPDDAFNEKELFNNASKALRAHKLCPVTDYQHFDQTLQFVANERMALENDLYKAIQNDEFFLVYQPIFDLQNNTLVKAEALLRWNHPTRGVLYPDLFIPVAEETKLIIEIGEIVFRKAMEMLKKWRKLYNPEFKVSINTSVVQYQAKNLLVDSWLNRHNVIHDKNHGLIVELTESVLLDDHENIAKQLDMLKQAGFEIALDDFGTGYSSLSYLQKFKFDYLKIDRSFIEDINLENENNALCKTIVLMGKNLGIKVIAEGVETETHLDVLKHMKAEFAQGYHYSKPITPESFEKLYF